MEFELFRTRLLHKGLCQERPLWLILEKNLCLIPLIFSRNPTFAPSKTVIFIEDELNFVEAGTSLKSKNLQISLLQ